MKEEAVLAYLVWNGAELDAPAGDGQSIRDKLLATGAPITHVLEEIQDRRYVLFEYRRRQHELTKP